MFRKLLVSISLMGITSLAFAGLKTNNMVVDFGIKASTAQFTTGAGAGKVFTSDADGNATWQTPATAITDHNNLTSTGTLTHSQLETSISNNATAITNETNARIAGDNALAVSTTTLQGNINGKVSKTGDTMTGDLNVPNLNATYGVVGATVTATSAFHLGTDAVTNSTKFEIVGTDEVHYRYDGAAWVETYRVTP